MAALMVLLAQFALRCYLPPARIDAGINELALPLIKFFVHTHEK